jgi:hypothetical protein
MKIYQKQFSTLLFIPLFLFFSCSKADSPTKPATTSYTLTFKADTVSVKLVTVTARLEVISGLSAVAVDGKSADTAAKKRSIVLRCFADSSRLYKSPEILISYKDELGDIYSNTPGDTTSKIVITKLDKKPKGIIEGSFELTVRNSQKSKLIQLKEGKFAAFFDE